MHQETETFYDSICCSVSFTARGVWNWTCVSPGSACAPWWCWFPYSIQVKKEVGDVSILINNAGIVTGRKFMDCPDELIEKSLDVNFKAHIWVSTFSSRYKCHPQVALAVKNSPASAGDLRDDHWVRKIPGKGNSNPLQYSCLENPMDRGAWQATVHGATKSWARLKRLRLPLVLLQ